MDDDTGMQSSRGSDDGRGTKVMHRVFLILDTYRASPSRVSFRLEEPPVAPAAILVSRPERVQAVCRTVG